MSRKPVLILALALLGGGSGYFLQHYRLDGLKNFKLLPRGGAVESETPAAEAAAEVAGGRSSLRIGTFRLNHFGLAQLDQPRSLRVLAEVAGSFDVLALEGLAENSNEVLRGLCEAVNVHGRKYDFLLGPASGREEPGRDAFVFDTQRLEVDRSALYAVADPDHLLGHPPLVGWFRARGVPADEAFTFTLMAVDTGPDELDAITAAYRAVRDDGRGEDDVILAGNFGADDKHLGSLIESAHLSACISGVPTNTGGDKQLDNILYLRSATELAGRAGVLDVVREFNLTVNEALAVSDHMPVWAEFSRYEGGEPGELARGKRPFQTR